MATQSNAASGAADHNLDPAPFLKSQQTAQEHYGRFNLLIVGRSGVGKSSLINAVFGRNLARIGVGLPITDGLSYYCDDTLGIWDSEGFEIGDSTPPAVRTRQTLDEIEKSPQDQQISVVWFCIDAHSKRLLPGEIDVIQEISSRCLPVILVLTKVPWSKNPLTGKVTVGDEVSDFWEWLHKPVAPDGHPLSLPVTEIVATSSLNAKGKGTGHGLSELVEKTLEQSPDSEKDSFRIAQRLNLSWKREMGRAVIATSSASAAVAAAVPIPIADATTLAPIQLTMLARISVIYELELKTMLSTSTLAQMATQFSGQALARSFIKLIPGIGSVINSVVASALTATVGEAWMRLCEQIYQGKVKPQDLEITMENCAPNVIDLVKGLLVRKSSRSSADANAQKDGH